jgi:glycine/D-amino acid oxidase-like deaminating enzyme
MSDKRRIAVVGAGIIGASIAWHLSRAGAAVTLLDASKRGGLATPQSFAWINASWGNPEPYFRLRERSMMEWRVLDRDVPGLRVNWCGGLIWDLPPDELHAFAKQHSAWGYGIHEVGAGEIARIEPNLKVIPEVAYHVPEEGAVEPDATAKCLIAGAEALGATVLENCRVRWLGEDDGKVSGVQTEEGFIHADETVVAAGAHSQDLLSNLGLSIGLTQPAGLLVHSQPAGELLRGLVMAPELHIRQTAEGRLVAGSDYAGTPSDDNVLQSAKDLHARVQSFLAGAEGLKMDFHTLGYRPTPADGFPAVGRPQNRAGLYLAVSHSGITLAPAIGLMTAAELLDGNRDELLAPYHPDRLISDRT